MRLGDLATYINGFAFKPDDWGEHGLPIIRIQNLTGTNEVFNYYDGEYPKQVEVTLTITGRNPSRERRLLPTN